MSYLREPTDISWAALQLQFGAVYPEARVAPSPGGLTLWPSPPHVPARTAGQLIDVTPAK